MDSGDSKTILIVDDEAAITTLAESVLRRAGYTAVIASNGEDALALCVQNKPCLVISDISMPGISGLALAERIGQLPEAPPVLLMSGFAEQALLASARAAGCGDNILSKPFRIQELLEAVSKSLGNERTRRAGDGAVLSS